MPKPTRKKNLTPNLTPKKDAKKPRKKRDWRAAFLKWLAKSGNVSFAANKAGISRETAYTARAVGGKDGADRIEAEAFAQQWDAALEVAIDALEMEARRRAIEGVREPVGWYKGEPGGYTRRYSDTLLIVLLKAHRPEKYRENVAHTVETWQDKVIAALRNGSVNVEEIRLELGDDIASELALAAGIQHSQGRETAPAEPDGAAPET